MRVLGSIIFLFLCLIVICCSGCIQNTTLCAPVAKDAEVTILWAGPGQAKLTFNNDDFFFTDGQKQTINFQSETLYTLKVGKIWKQFVFNDFLDFAKGVQNITVSLKNDTISVINSGKIINQIDSQMILVLGSSFDKGCGNTYGSPCDDWEKRTDNDSTVLKDFYIGKYDVTQTQWEAVMGNNPSYFKNCAECPVENVSWNDVQKFIKILNQLSGHHYRLPTDAEWEYAARGGKKRQGDYYAGHSGDIAWNELSEIQWQLITGHKLSNFKNCDGCLVQNLSWDNAKEFITKLNQWQKDMHCHVPSEKEWENLINESNLGYKYAGNNNLDTVAWYYGNTDYRTHAVGQKLPNELGLYDMNGNVWQWCSNWWDNDDWNYGTRTPRKSSSDPQDPANPLKRVVHGSPWWLTYSRVTFLFGWAPDYKFNDTGFRLARDN
jgi:formylglycine-generating enzyme required for sulfatase activity